MDEQHKRELTGHGYTFMAHDASVAGWRNELASVTTDLPGFYHTTWEEVAQAKATDGVIRVAWLASKAWLGVH